MYMIEEWDKVNMRWNRWSKHEWAAERAIEMKRILVNAGRCVRIVMAQGPYFVGDGESRRCEFCGFVLPMGCMSRMEICPMCGTSLVRAETLRLAGC